MSTILDLVDGHEFTKLFVEELGWDRPDAHKTWTPPTAGEGYTLTQAPPSAACAFGTARPSPPGPCSAASTMN
ncbi:hypothetical protein [Kocuria sp. CNJ-770]|uniref:hypothetical protein n=1 Tax=Kocuria sp. CNJ-770 TaxID=1904964 RepID=UPI0016518D4E|nr:hypothetical protein [Kocuria sp. CNJ-770]